MFKIFPSLQFCMIYRHLNLQKHIWEFVIQELLWWGGREVSVGKHECLSSESSNPCQNLSMIAQVPVGPVLWGHGELKISEAYRESA